MTGHKGLAMTQTEFEDFLDRFGADPGRWPQDRRDQMLAFMTADPAARQLFEEAQAVEKLLACDVIAMDATGLKERILAAAPLPPRQGVSASDSKAKGLLQRLFGPVFAAAAAGAFGVWVAIAALPPVEEEAAARATAGLLIDEAFGSVDEVSL